MFWYLFALAAGLVGAALYANATVRNFNWLRFFTTFLFIALACYGAVNLFHLTQDNNYVG